MMVENAVANNPGIWTCKLCRLLNGIPETKAGIAWCGLCLHFANVNKRARAEALAAIPTLPGMTPPYQIHPACTCIPLKKLQYLLRYLAEETDLIRLEPGTKVPDMMQARGYDLATACYPKN